MSHFLPLSSVNEHLQGSAVTSAILHSVSAPEGSRIAPHRTKLARRTEDDILAYQDKRPACQVSNQASASVILLLRRVL